MSRLRLAVIGAGHLGKLHARLAAQTDLFQLVGIVDPLEKARCQAAQELDVPIWQHHRALTGSIDAAVVATPTVHHHRVTLDLLRRGIHVMVEKPLAVNGAQAEELVDTAQECGVRLQVGHIEQFNPAIQAARPLVDRPIYIEAVRTSGYTFRSTDIGVVLDLMIHDLDLILSLVNGPIREIHALGASVMGIQEDMAQARVEFENGCVANLTASRTSFTAQRTMQIFGAGGFLGLDFAKPSLCVIRPAPQLVRRQFDIHNLSDHQREHYKQHLFDELLPTEELQLESCNPLLEELKDFGNSIMTGGAARVSGRQGCNAILAAEQVLSAIESHSALLRNNDSRSVGGIPLPSVVRPAAWPAEGDSDGSRRKAG